MTEICIKKYCLAWSQERHKYWYILGTYPSSLLQCFLLPKLPHRVGHILHKQSHCGVHIVHKFTKYCLRAFWWVLKNRIFNFQLFPKYLFKPCSPCSPPPGLHRGRIPRTGCTPRWKAPRRGSCRTPCSTRGYSPSREGLQNNQMFMLLNKISPVNAKFHTFCLTLTYKRFTIWIGLVIYLGQSCQN